VCLAERLSNEAWDHDTGTLLFSLGHKSGCFSFILVENNSWLTAQYTHTHTHTHTLHSLAAEGAFHSHSGVKHTSPEDEIEDKPSPQTQGSVEVLKHGMLW